MMDPHPPQYGGYEIDGNVTTKETYIQFGRDLAKAVQQAYFND